MFAVDWLITFSEWCYTNAANKLFLEEKQTAKRNVNIKNTVDVLPKSILYSISKCGWASGAQDQQKNKSNVWHFFSQQLGLELFTQVAYIRLLHHASKSTSHLLPGWSPGGLLGWSAGRRCCPSRHHLQGVVDRLVHNNRCSYLHAFFFVKSTESAWGQWVEPHWWFLILMVSSTETGCWLDSEGVGRGKL